MQKEVYSSKEDFMKSQFPEYYKKNTIKKKDQIVIQIEEKVTYKNDCLHEHCIIDNHLVTRKGKLTLVYRCKDCNTCVLDSRSFIGGMMILTLANTFSKNTTINYQKVLNKK